MNKTHQIAYYIRKKKMYLISIYFDEKTEFKIRGYINQIAKHTGNTCMLDGNVPPHITIAGFKTNCEETAKKLFLGVSKEICSECIQWVSVGAFLPGVLYITPVLNEYLHQLSETYNNEAVKYEDLQIDQRYIPFQWLPHTTLAKHLTGLQMKKAFEVIQSQFAPFDGNVVKIGLAKTNPYQELLLFELK